MQMLSRVAVAVPRRLLAVRPSTSFDDTTRPRINTSSRDRSNRPGLFVPLRIPSAASIVAAAPAIMQPYLQIMRADKPIGTWLLYWPCTWSIALATPAGHLPSLYMLGLFGTGAFLMRSAGCVINDLWDKDFDKKVERTRMRPLACGSLSEKQAVALLAGLLSSSLAILLQLNWFSVVVGASSMALVVGYPLAKRFTYWPQVVLGATLNWGVLIAWSALQSMDVWYQVLPLYLATVCHTIVYDSIYSHQTWKPLHDQGLQGFARACLLTYVFLLFWRMLYDKHDDIMIGVKSTALRFGENTKLWLSGFSAVTVSGLGVVGHLSDQTWPYYLALAGTAGHLAWQVGTVNIHDGTDCWRKFRSNQFLGLLLFAGIVASTLLKEEKKEDVEAADMT